jgi:phage-related protein
MGEKMSEFVGGIKKFFGIESPSKLFADEVGRWIPAGIAEGIDQGMGILDKEIESMTNDMIQTSINPTVMSQYTPEAESDDLSLVIDLLNSWLPLIASNTGKKMELGVNASQLFRVIQQESIRNTELVGTGAVLSAT